VKLLSVVSEEVVGEGREKKYKIWGTYTVGKFERCQIYRDHSK
jgi:hypothetical protein